MYEYWNWVQAANLSAERVMGEVARLLCLLIPVVNPGFVTVKVGHLTQRTEDHKYNFAFFWKNQET